MDNLGTAEYPPFEKRGVRGNAVRLTVRGELVEPPDANSCPLRQAQGERIGAKRTVLAPDKRHPKADVVAQDDWEKNSPKSLAKSTGHGRAKARSG